jgi:hypothetical protein
MGVKGKKWYINLTKGEAPPLSKLIEVPLLLKLHCVSTYFKDQRSKFIAKVKNLANIIRTLLNVICLYPKFFPTCFPCSMFHACH